MSETTSRYYHLPICTGSTQRCGGKYNCPACAYEAGRNDERERCARIAESWLDRSVGELIAEKIIGGQDEK